MLAHAPATRPVARAFLRDRLRLSGLFLGSAGLWALVLGCQNDSGRSGGTTPSPTAPIEEQRGGLGRLGVPVRTEHFVILASAFEPCPAERAAARWARTERVGVELNIQRIGSVQVPANPYYATLVDADNEVFEATLGGCGTPLGPALPEPGQYARGWVVFEVPSGKRNFTLVYDPELIEVPQREVTIALGR